MKLFWKLNFANYVAVNHSRSKVVKKYLVGFVYIITRLTDERNYVTDQNAATSKFYFRFNH